MGLRLSVTIALNRWRSEPPRIHSWGSTHDRFTPSVGFLVRCLEHADGGDGSGGLSSRLAWLARAHPRRRRCCGGNHAADLVRRQQPDLAGGRPRPRPRLPLCLRQRDLSRHLRRGRRQSVGARLRPLFWQSALAAAGACHRRHAEKRAVDRRLLHARLRRPGCLRRLPKRRPSRRHSHHHRWSPALADHDQRLCDSPGLRSLPASLRRYGDRGGRQQVGRRHRRSQPQHRGDRLAGAAAHNAQLSLADRAPALWP